MSLASLEKAKAFILCHYVRRTKRCGVAVGSQSFTQHLELVAARYHLQDSKMRNERLFLFAISPSSLELWK